MYVCKNTKMLCYGSIDAIILYSFVTILCLTNEIITYFTNMSNMYTLIYVYIILLYHIRQSIIMFLITKTFYKI